MGFRYAVALFAIALFPGSMFAYPLAVEERYAEEQNWSIRLDLKNIDRSLAVAHVSMQETIHPLPSEDHGYWWRIGPFRIRGEITNVEAREVSTNRTLPIKVSITPSTNDITVLFAFHQKDGYRVRLSYDWWFKVNQSDSVLTLDQLGRFTFRWDSLSVAQLQTDGQILCCDVPQKFTVFFPKDLAVANLTHGAVPIDYTEQAGASEDSAEFSVLLPKGFLSSQGKPIPRIFEWKLVLGTKRVLMWIVTPKPNQNATGVIQLLALVSSAKPINESGFRIDNSSWRPLNVSGNIVSGFWNTTDVLNGNHTIAIFASNRAGENTTETVFVNVDNPIVTYVIRVELRYRFRPDYLVYGLLIAGAFLAASSLISRYRKKGKR